MPKKLQPLSTEPHETSIAKAIAYINHLASAKFAKYIVTGGLAFIVDYGIFSTCFVIFQLSAGISATAGMSAGILVGFGLNKTWTFKSKLTNKIYAQLILYLILVVFNYFFTISTLITVGTYIPVLILKPMLSALIAVWNFFICKHIIFKKTGF